MNTTKTTTIIDIAQEPRIIVPNQLQELRYQDGKRILKMWLADDSLTFQGNRRVNREALPDIVKTILGKKYIIPNDLNHPQVKEPVPYNLKQHIEMINAASQPYVAGTFYDYERNHFEGKEGWSAYVDLDTELGQRLFDAGLIPRYNSTSMMKLDPTEPEDNITKALINNVCAVKFPNYGIKSAIQGYCVGSRDSCKTGLMNNSVTDGTATDWSNTQTTMNFDIECPTMRALRELDDDNIVRFDKSIFNNQHEIQSSIMSSQTGTSTASASAPNSATTEGTIVVFPSNNRQIKIDSTGKIVSDTHSNDKLPGGFEALRKKAEAERPKDEGGDGNGDNKPEGGKEDKNANGNIQVESKKQQSKEEEKEKIKASEVEKPDQDKGDDTGKDNPPEQKVDPVQNDRVGNLESQVKQLTSQVEKANTNVNYYRKQMIADKVNSATWLKKEEKDERINRYNKMDIHGEDLKFMLDDAFRPQEVTAKVGERKNSAYIDDGTREIKNSSDEDKPQKLSADLLRRNKTN
jgi:hypothetical protein